MHVKQPVAITLNDHINHDQQQGSHHNNDFQSQPPLSPFSSTPKLAEQQDHPAYKSGNNQDWRRYQSHHNLETNYVAIQQPFISNSKGIVKLLGVKIKMIVLCM